MEKLDSYLNDHLAGSVSALELIAHWAHLHEGTSLGVFFSQIDTEIRADQSVLRNLMRRLSVEESSLRQAGAWAAEKVGRVRLMIAGGEQGSLGLVLTLEGLIMGIVGKKLLWRSLTAANLAELNGYDFRELERRAEQQIDRIEAERIRAARLVLTDGASQG
jgi:translation initiation factor 2B subunit (eIF-2B alpha/beta/delta family)